MYLIKPSEKYQKEINRFVRGNFLLKKPLEKVLLKLSHDPFYLGIKTHEVNINGQRVYSSRLTGDLRILWIFKNSKRTIYLMQVGGHSGKRRVYSVI